MFSIKIPGETKVITYENFNKRANYSLSVARYFINDKVARKPTVPYFLHFYNLSSITEAMKTFYFHVYEHPMKPSLSIYIPDGSIL